MQRAPSTPVGKRVKRHYFQQTYALAWDAVPYNFYPAQTWYVPDDIRIVGVQIKCSSAVSGTLQDGAIHTHAELSTAGDRALDGNIVEAESNCHFETEAIGMGFMGDPNQTSILMFPEGYGIDVDEGEYIYLHMGCFCDMLSAGTHEHASYGTIYYVER